jgi:hypothetical protein
MTFHSETTGGSEPSTIRVRLVAIALVLFIVSSLLSKSRVKGSNLPICNRKFLFEPSLFAKIRWALSARRILDEAYEKVGLALPKIGASLKCFSTKELCIESTGEILN